MAKILRRRLKSEGRSLYVGAGVAEIPMLVMETLELHRKVAAFNLRAEEVTVLNAACKELPFQFSSGDASTARGTFDHLWIVSVLNDPERFPHLSSLSYGRADPVAFDPVKFERERGIVRSTVDRCMRKLSLPGLVTTSSEEVLWIAEWCHRKRIPYVVARRHYPTVLVGDPICFIRLIDKAKKSR